MSKAIKRMYRGIKDKPKGKGIHKRKFHSCVSQCAKGQGNVIKGKANCYAVCMSQLGKTKAVRKGHRRRKK